MKLTTFSVLNAPGREERVGLLLSDGRLADVTSAYADFLSSEKSASGAEKKASALLPPKMVGIIRRGNEALDALRTLLEHCEVWLAKGEDPPSPTGGRALIPQEEITFKAPVTRPGKIIALGINYRDHLDEGGAVHNAPPFPMAFNKVVTTITGHRQPIRIPKGSSQIDYEVELAMVIGQGGVNIEEKDWKKHIFGYTILNDVSEREIQFPELKVGLLNLGKNFPTFAPMGPWLITPDEIPDPEDIAISCWVNDEAEPRQSSTTRNLIFGMPRTVAHFSRMGLEPGDVISTGTPSGVAAFRTPPDPWWLKAGDEVRCLASGIGELVNPVVASG